MAWRHKKLRPDPDVMYVCWNGFASHNPDGRDFVAARGTLLRGDHELVQRFPERFVRAGVRLPDPEVTGVSRSL